MDSGKVLQISVLAGITRLAMRFALRQDVEHLIPTLLGLAGALAPVAVEFWQRERVTTVRQGRSSRLSGVSTATGFLIDDAVVRGGRVYL